MGGHAALRVSQFAVHGYSKGRRAMAMSAAYMTVRQTLPRPADARMGQGSFAASSSVPLSLGISYKGPRLTASSGMPLPARRALSTSPSLGSDPAQKRDGGEVGESAESKYTAASAFFDALWDAGVTHCFVNLGSDHPAIIEAMVRGQRTKKGRFPRILTVPNEVCVFLAV